MAGKTKKGAALQVFLLDEEMRARVGETLHLTIRPLDEVYSIIPGIRYCIYVGTPKGIEFSL